MGWLMLGRGKVVAVAMILVQLQSPNIAWAQQSNLDLEIARHEMEANQVALRVESRTPEADDEILLDEGWEAPAVQLIPKAKSKARKN